MQIIVTAIAAEAGDHLSESAADRIRQTVAEIAGAAAARADWLNKGIACDIAVAADDLDRMRAAIRKACADAPFDIVVQPAVGRRKSLLIADMDSTIVTSETLDELAGHAGLKDRVAAITERAMRGETDFKGALRERVAMLTGLPEAALADTLAGIELTPGARTLVRTMRASGAYTALVSGGFGYFTSRVAAACGFHEDRANSLLIEDGVLTGRVGEPILDRESKLATLRELATSKNVPLPSTMATGDGANDLPMILAAGLGVAFRAKPALEDAAPAAIRHGDLTALLYLQGYRRPQFVED